MNILLIVASQQRSLIDFAGKERKGAIIPPDSLRRGYLGRFEWNTQVNSIDISDMRGPDDLHAFVRERSDSARISILLIDEERFDLTHGIRNAIICCPIRADIEEKKFQNYFAGTISKILKSINYIAPLIEDASDRILLSLPLRNFSSQEIVSMQETVSNRFPHQDFTADIDAALKGLRKKLKPRKRSRFQHHIYVVDDKGRHFIYGKEKHSRPESGGDHKSCCTLTSMFRFGFRIDTERHYNVSEGDGDETTISGEFPNCHDEMISVKNKTHLNMFSNDYF